MPTGAPGWSTIWPPSGNEVRIHATRRARSSSTGCDGTDGAAEGRAVSSGEAESTGVAADGSFGALDCGAEQAIRVTTGSVKPSLPAQKPRSETRLPTYEEEYRSTSLGNIPDAILLWARAAAANRGKGAFISETRVALRRSSGHLRRSSEPGAWSR